MEVIYVVNNNSSMGNVKWLNCWSGIIGNQHMARVAGLSDGIGRGALAQGFVESPPRCELGTANSVLQQLAQL